LALTLHIAGCGRVGRTLARLWAERGTFAIGWVFNRRRAGAEAATAFIGAGTPVDAPGPIAVRDWLMLAAPDGELDGLARCIATRSGRPALAFHVSGAEPAGVLAPLDCPVAAVHPVRPFSDPESAARAFAGTPALGEGDAAALDRPLPAFEAIGARPSRFRPTDKRRYHAAAIAASNFLNVLDQLALDLAESAGLRRAQALDLIVSLQRAALDNIAATGPAASLTGPIERGDLATCRRLAGVLADAPGDRRGVLPAMARAAADLADRKHAANRYDNPLAELFADGLHIESDGGNDGAGNGGV